MRLRTVFLVAALGLAGCGTAPGTGADTDTLQAASTELPTSNQQPDPSLTTTTTTADTTTTDEAHAADVLPGLGRSSDAQVRDEFLAAYQVYLREIELHRCMADQGMRYAPQVDYPGPFDRLLGHSPDVMAEVDPLVSDLDRAEQYGPIEFTDESKAVVERINLGLADSLSWNESQATEFGDRWSLARFGVTLDEIDAAGEEGFPSKGCEADYWSAVPSVWDLRNVLRPYVDAYPKAMQEQSFQECRQEFGFSAETLGDLEGESLDDPETSEGGLLDECLARWDAAGQAARQAVAQGDLVAELEVRFAEEIAEQRSQLDQAMTDESFLAVLRSD